jgi:hypothetical protein
MSHLEYTVNWLMRIVRDEKAPQRVRLATSEILLHFAAPEDVKEAIANHLAKARIH